MDNSKETVSLLQFPCTFPLKIIGDGEADFPSLVVRLVRDHVADLDETQITRRTSSSGRYQALSVIINAQDRAQLDALYQTLSAHPRITMVL